MTWLNVKPIKLHVCVMWLLLLVFLNGCGFAKLEEVVVNDRRAGSGQVVDLQVLRQGEPVIAKTGMTLRKGDEIHTGPNSTAAISFREGGEVLMRPNTRISILNPTIFEYFGEIYITIKGKFDVKTEYAIAGSEGTEYLVKVDQDDVLTVTVIEGSVRLSSKTGQWPSVRVGLLEQAKILGQQAPAKERLNSEEFNSTIEWINKARQVIGHSQLNRIVPDVKMLDVGQAKSQLHLAYLRLGKVRKSLTGSAEVGLVTGQSPNANSRIPADSFVDITVEAEPVIVPNLVRMSKLRAARILQQRKLVLGTAERVLSDIPVGKIVDQRPSSGTTVMAGSKVDISYSAPSSYVPSVVNLPLYQAKSRILNNSLVLGNVTEEITGRVAAGTVLSQLPDASQKVFTGAQVNLVVEGDSVLVPRLVGMQQRSARRLISDNRLRIGVVNERISGRAAAGVILEQHPPAGTRVRPGEVINLELEGESVMVPNVSGMGKDRAIAELRAARLDIGRIDTQRVNHARAGTVLNQSLNANTRVAPGTRISITVAAEIMIVPRLIGMRLDDAMNALSRNKLYVGRRSTQLSDRYVSGTIVSQSPQPGAQVDPGSRINVVLSEAGVRVPDVTRNQIRTATQILSRRGLGYTVSKLTDNRYGEGIVIRQNPRPNDLVRKGTRINLSVSTGPPRCKVPGVLRMNPAQAIQKLRDHQFIGRVIKGGNNLNYIVTEQSPREGSSIKCGSTVYLTTKAYVY